MARPVVSLSAFCSSHSGFCTGICFANSGGIRLVGFPARKHTSEDEDIFLAHRSEAACSFVLEHGGPHA